MKFLSQMGLAVVAIVVVVFLVTWVSQQVDTTGDTPTAATTSGNTPTAQPATQQLPAELAFPVSIMQWDPPTAGEIEVRTSGHHDFWFENRNSVPVNFGLTSASCKCSTISACVLTPEEAKRYQAYVLSAGTFAAAQVHAGFLSAWTQIMLDRRVSPAHLGAKPHWLRLSDAGEKVTAAPHTSGMVRVSWDGEKKIKPAAERLKVTLWAQGDEGSAPSPRTAPVLELPLTIVPALRVLPNEAEVGDLALGEQKTVEFICWSATRASFPLQTRNALADPCITSTVTPLSVDELRHFEEGMPVRALAGYRVRVTVHERLADSVQMDLGPFHRRIMLSSDPDIEEVAVPVSGRVRGDIIVGAEEDKGKIALGSVRSRHGMVKSVRLTTLIPGLELKADRIEPDTLDYLKVKSLKRLAASSGEQGTRWELTVEVPPGAPPGDLPDHSAIYLTAGGNPPRHIRIPVTGMIYQ
jgi:hypothetical protein